tara:strand:- start:1173 stop:1592 length:420 start_codon:yes stop_codon:yes gene_type:complete
MQERSGRIEKGLIWKMKNFEKMTKRFVVGSIMAALVFIGVGQVGMAQDFPEQVRMADSKVLLERYDEAEKIYKKIVASNQAPVVTAYVHYKLGMLYRNRDEDQRATAEYEKGLAVLAEAGVKDHQIGKYLAQAMAGPQW